MSAEESKIRSELEMDVERDLEGEIKEEMYLLALRLHRLYQQQKDREVRELYVGTKNQQGIKKKALSEVNINIKMEGGTKIEINEIKKEGGESDRKPKSTAYKSEQNMSKTYKSAENTRRQLVAPSRKKFDWVKTLRSGPGAVEANWAKALKGSRMWDDNVQTDRARKNINSALGQRNGKKLLKLKL